MYEACIRPPAVGDLLPCREGGSIHTTVESRLNQNRPKRLMVFYTPRGLDGPARTGGSALWPAGENIHALLRSDVEECAEEEDWPIDLSTLADCTMRGFTAPSGYSGLRGLAVVPELPAARYYHKPWCYSPEGHVISIRFEMDTNVPELPTIRLHLIANGPVEIPRF